MSFNGKNMGECSRKRFLLLLRLTVGEQTTFPLLYYLSDQEQYKPNILLLPMRGTAFKWKRINEW